MGTEYNSLLFANIKENKLISNTIQNYLLARGKHQKTKKPQRPSIRQSVPTATVEVGTNYRKVNNIHLQTLQLPSSKLYYTFDNC